MSQERRCIVLRGDRATTRREAGRLTERLDSVLTVGPGAVPPGRVRAHLGGAFEAVVLDGFDGVDADLLGQIHGLVLGGGALVLCLPEAPPRSAALAVYPYTVCDVATRFFERLERYLGTSPAVTSAPAPLSRPTFVPRSTEEQEAVVARLGELFASPDPVRAALIADRGRGKSSALGLSVRRARALRRLHVAIAAPSGEAAREVLRFAGDDSPAPRFVPVAELLRPGSEALDVILVDEAAQLPVPVLRALVRRHPNARIAFASTAHGYEGTGQGFMLRFLEWLRAGEGRAPDPNRAPPRLELLTLSTPIRWLPNDPLERLVFDVLALDAETAPVTRESRARPSAAGAGAPEARELDRETLARDESLLRAVFGLLAHAHYRTTPGDLQRLLDAPNLAVHAMIHDGRVLAATVVAREGGLPPELCAALGAGRARIRGHALADTLITHAARPEAGSLRMLRSVRIATHPAVRGLGLGRALVEHVHRRYTVDLFGTLFGATPELLQFRRSLGYRLVRVGTARGARSGEPAAVMIRPGSERGARLVDSLVADLARDLSLQLELIAVDEGFELDPELARALAVDLPRAVELDGEEVAARVRRYLEGPQPFNAAAFAVTRFVEEHRSLLRGLCAPERALIEQRVMHRRSWEQVARAAGLDGPAAAMRALRPALRQLAARAGLVPNDDAPSAVDAFRPEV
ncbi:MAG TPA: GNAT family N-acetyltransferase [Polyangiaceae bacterium]|nr:GNAT family N-acetyltransferase [Polyangiaceae bacterium]